MRQFQYSYETSIGFSVPVAYHFFKLRCRPDSFATQSIVNERLQIDPHEGWMEGRDSLGNAFVCGSILQPHTFFHCVSEGIVRQEAPYRIPGVVQPLYVYASPLTALSDEMAQFLAPFDVRREGVWPTAVALSEQVHAWLAYTPGATNVDTTAAVAFRLRQGVCQDYAHILIACLRQLGIPARYVCGLLLGEGATHAWVEVYDGEAWCGLDPTNRQIIEYGYLKIAHGRDAADCPVNRGVFRGVAQQQTEVCVRVHELYESTENENQLKI